MQRYVYAPNSGEGAAFPHAAGERTTGGLRVGPEVERVQAREKNRELAACDEGYGEMHGKGEVQAMPEAGRCKQRAGNTRATQTEAGTHLDASAEIKDKRESTSICQCAWQWQISEFQAGRYKHRVRATCCCSSSSCLSVCARVGAATTSNGWSA